MNRFFTNSIRYAKYARRSAFAELKSEVTDSYLNWLWWVIEPTCFCLIYTFVFTVVFKNKTPYYPAFVFLGQTMWDFFNRMSSGSVNLIKNNRDLVTKVYIPKYVLLTAKSITYLIKMFISLGITVVLIIVLRVPPTRNILYFIPILLILYMFCYGVGLILMNYGVILSDLSNLVTILLRMIYFLTGVFYNISERLGPGLIRYLLLRVNPIAFLMDGARKALLWGETPSLVGMAFWGVISIALCAIGVHLIHKNENSYAKVI